MGVSYQSNFIKFHAKEAKERITLEDLRGSRVAVDTLQLIYLCVTGVRSSGMDILNKDGLVVSHLHGILFKIVKLLEYDIKPIFVFDGEAPELKHHTLTYRREERKKAEQLLKTTEETMGIKTAKDIESPEEKKKYIEAFKKAFRPNKKQITELKSMLDILGLPYIQSPGEADVVCAWLAKNKYVDGVITDDFDTLLFGAPVIYKQLLLYINTEKEMYSMNKQKILDCAGLNAGQLIDIGILMGCDYCPKVPGIGPERAYSLIIEYGNLKNVLLQYHKEHPDLEIPFDECLNAKKYFEEAVGKLSLEHEQFVSYSPVFLRVNAEDFINFMCVKHGFNFDIIMGALNSITYYQSIYGINGVNNYPDNQKSTPNKQVLSQLVFIEDETISDENKRIPLKNINLSNKIFSENDHEQPLPTKNFTKEKTHMNPHHENYTPFHLFKQLKANKKISYPKHHYLNHLI
jgi:flap endonuclease-1